MATLTDMFGGGATETLLGLPKGRDGDIVVLGADCATPYASVGAYCAGGPQAMRAGAAVYSSDLGKMNFDLGHPVLPDGVRAVDGGDLSVDPSTPAENRQEIESAIRAVLQAGGVPMLLGGDDSLPIPMLAAFAGAGPITILQIDAHIDWRNELEGERMGLSSTMRRASEMEHVQRIVQVGARGIGSAGPAEFEAATKWGSHFVMAQALHEEGPAQALQAIPDGARVVICFDCDALDPAIMPSVIAPTAGGLSYMQALALILGVASKADIAGFALVEFMPDADLNGVGARTAGQMLASCLGVIAGQVAAKR